VVGFSVKQQVERAQDTNNSWAERERKENDTKWEGKNAARNRILVAVATNGKKQ